MIQVRDGSRTLQFNGTLLGESSSRRRDSTRWVEFSLYRTESGSYVLSRIGVSLFYHKPECTYVERYGLSEEPVSTLRPDAVPCYECVPPRRDPVYPERERHWAQVSDDAEGVLESLYKHDNGGARYLTRVAQRLLEAACRNDLEIERVYRVEVIP